MAGVLEYLKMKKSILLIVFIIVSVFTAVFSLSAETVYVDELQKTADSSSIEFQNYSGPHNRIDTIEEIRGIGRYLGRSVEREAAEFTFFGKYSVIHAVDYSASEGLDADIFILHETASVDHIKNLRRMVSGYLERAYGYEIEQADLLAEFVTIYNAVHRNELEYFSGIYKNAVTRHLIDGKTGIALSYLEWPGKTMLVIPLTPQAGEEVISDLDTDILSDEDVIEQLQTEDDRGVESRQDLVELKDQEVLEEREKIEEERAGLEQQKDELAEKKEVLEEEKQELEEKDDVDSRIREQQVENEIAEIEKEEEVIAEAEEKLDEREKVVEEREDRIVAEREEIADDQMKNIEEDGRSSDAAVDAEEEEPEIVTVPFLKISGDAGDYTGQLLLIDTAGGGIVKRSEVDSIRLRGYRASGDSIISVAGSGGADRIVSLVRIDPETLEITDSAVAEVYIDSVIVEKSGMYYAVVRDGGWKIGIFDRSLKLESVSSVEVFPATDIVVNGSGVLVQNPAGNIVIISEEDFSSPSF